MVSRQAILDVLRTIDDPEMPINVVDLGIIDAVCAKPMPGAGPSGRAVVEIDVLPTFVGCPALELIEKEIKRKLGRLEGVESVQVHFKYEPPWTVDRITPAGRERLRKFGLTVPERRQAGEADPSAPVCPFCGSANVRLESPFGPTRCRMIYHCESCRHPFEHLKRVSLVS
jgi:ring-1,2-phenylacetyl-CoA epoxidase subunit PaaD